MTAFPWLKKTLVKVSAIHRYCVGELRRYVTFFENGIAGANRYACGAICTGFRVDEQTVDRLVAFVSHFRRNTGYRAGFLAQVVLRTTISNNHVGHGNLQSFNTRSASCVC